MVTEVDLPSGLLSYVKSVSAGSLLGRKGTIAICKCSNSIFFCKLLIVSEDGLIVKVEVLDDNVAVMISRSGNSNDNNNCVSSDCCGSVGWALSCRVKGRWLDSRSRHMPRLWVCPWLGHL